MIHRILIVEDEIAIAMDIENRLKKMGFEITGIAINKAEAIKAFAEVRPDVVLQDIQLGEKNEGIALSAYFSEQGCAVVFLTAFGDTNTFSEALATAPAGYVTKPFRDDDLRRQLELAIKKQSEIRGLQELLLLHEQFAGISETPSVLLAPDQRLLKINPAMERISGYLNVEITGKPITLIFEINPETNQIMQLIHRNKQHIPFPATLTPIHNNPGNECIGFVILPAETETTTATTVTTTTHELINSKAVFIRDKSVLYRVPFENIYWLEAMDNYTKIHTQQKTYTIKLFLKDALAKLPADKFVRIHRSYAVALEHITMLEEDTLYIGSTGLPVGGQYWNEIKEWFKFS